MAPIEEAHPPGESVTAALTSYLKAVERGEKTNLARLLADHTELVEEFSSFVATKLRFSKTTLNVTPASTSQSRTTDNPPQPPASEPCETTITFQQRSVPASRDVGPFFGDYELMHVIAHGGMGVVYKARQTTLNRIVAVKMILGGRLAGPESVQRFQTEAEAAAQLDHPGIVPIYEVGEHDGQHYYSMGFVEGQSLARLVGDGPLEPRAAAELVKTVCDAVQYAHDRGVIHRDLKPGNVLLDQDGRPRVTDFGLAKLTESGSELTGTGQVLGTPSYMPPEQAAGKIDQIGPPADVYSLGAILYCLLIGHPPFRAASSAETLQQVLKQEPVPLRQLNSHVPIDLETVTQKCLQKDISRRYGSARDLAAELDRFLKGEPILARPVSTVERGWRWCRRNPIVAGLLAAFLSVLMGGFAGSFWIRMTAEREMKVMLRDELTSLLNANVEALELWMKAQRSNATTAADATAVRALAKKLATLGEQGDVTPLQLLQSPTQGELRQAMRPWLETHGYNGFLVVNRAMKIVGSTSDELVGREQITNYAGFVERALDGQQTVSHPFPETILLPDEKGRLRTGVPAMYAAAPVRDDTGEVIAALAMRIRPETDFTRILQVARKGKSGETYVFDKSGRLLSESRFDDDLKQTGLIPNEDDARSILTLIVKDPQVELTSGAQPPGHQSDLPLTRAVAAAAAGKSDVDVDGYRNYRGVMSLGAWRWLPEYDFGVITEADKAEADMPLYSVTIGFRWWLRILVASAIMIILFAVSISLLKRRTLRRAAHNQVAARL